MAIIGDKVSDFSKNWQIKLKKSPAEAGDRLLLIF